MYAGFRQINEGSRYDVVQTECRKFANNKRQRHLLCNTKDVFAFISMAADSIKEKGAFELSLKDAVAFMSANSTVDFPVCQQESAIKIVFSKVQFLVVRCLTRETWYGTVGRFYLYVVRMAYRGCLIVRLRRVAVGTGFAHYLDGMSRVLIMGLWCVTVQTGCSRRSLTAQSIHLREKSIAGPTERPKGFSLFGSQGSDHRFSMKMVFAPYPRSCQPV